MLAVGETVGQIPANSTPVSHLPGTEALGRFKKQSGLAANSFVDFQTVNGGQSANPQLPLLATIDPA